MCRWLSTPLHFDLGLQPPDSTWVSASVLQNIAMASSRCAAQSRPCVSRHRSWPEATLCTIFSTIWVCCHNLTICSHIGLILRDLGAVRCGSLVLSWRENKFFGDENFIQKTRCFPPPMFLFSDFFLNRSFASTHRMIIVWCVLESPQKEWLRDKFIFFLIPTFNLSYCVENPAFQDSNFHCPKYLSDRLVRRNDEIKIYTVFYKL